MENGMFPRIKDMEEVFKHGLMDPDMKATGIMIKPISEES